MKADLIKVELTPESIAPKQASCNRSNDLSLENDRLTVCRYCYNLLAPKIRLDKGKKIHLSALFTLKRRKFSLDQTDNGQHQASKNPFSCEADLPIMSVVTTAD
jgi:hypothetical protein